MQQRIDSFLTVQSRRPAVDTNDQARCKRVVALFDRHGLSVSAWAERGFECEAHDPAVDDHGIRMPRGVSGVALRRTRLRSAEDLRQAIGDPNDVAFVVAQPPCRDLCAAGARWWKRKSERNPAFQSIAKRFLRMLYSVLTELNVPFALLVPAGMHIQRCFPRPPFLFNPCDFGGFLPPRAPHPLFCSIPPQDAYTKRTLCVTSPGVLLPARDPVPPVFLTVPLKHGGVKRVTPIMHSRHNTAARNCAPVGFCTALCLAATRPRA
jgi:hypothetical protein